MAQQPYPCIVLCFSPNLYGTFLWSTKENIFYVINLYLKKKSVKKYRHFWLFLCWLFLLLSDYSIEVTNADNNLQSIQGDLWNVWDFANILNSNSVNTR